MSKTPQFEIPTDLRKMTEQSMEQVKTAINGYLQFFQRGIPSNVMGSSELSNKVFGCTERNVASAFEFAIFSAFDVNCGHNQARHHWGPLFLGYKKC